MAKPFPFDCLLHQNIQIQIRENSVFLFRYPDASLYGYTHTHTHTPGTPVRHSILHAAQAGLLITHVHHAGTAQATAIGGRHRLLVYHDGCTFKDRRLVFKTGWRGAYMQ